MLVFKTYLVVEIACDVAFVFMVFYLFLFFFLSSGAAGDFFHCTYFFFVLVMFVSLFLVCLVWLQNAFRVAGALPVLVEVLKVHQGHAGVAEQACFALGFLACFTLGHRADNNDAIQVTSHQQNRQTRCSTKRSSRRNF